MPRIAIIQVGRREDKTTEHVLGIIDENGLDKASILFLPENWYTRKPVHLAEILEVSDDLSRRLGKNIHLFAGLHYVKAGSLARSVGVYSVNGESRIVCEKIHPSKPVGERGFLVPGTYLEPIEVDGVRIGCVGCVDMMYPELSRIHSLLGALIIYNPSSIPGDRRDMWQSVGLARSVENQVYVVGVSTTGVRYPDGRITMGGSFVAHPEGRIAVDMGGAEGIAYYDVSLKELEAMRERRSYYEDLERLYKPFYMELYRRLAKGG